MTDRTLDLHLRWLIRTDMPEVIGIEAANFPYPWSEEDFIKCLRQRDCIGFVAEHNERIAGFMLYQLHKKRIHILSLAVHASLHRKGVGRALVERLKGKLSKGSVARTRIHAEVRERNLEAQLFLRELGFKVVSVLQAFYDDTPEDAYLFEFKTGGQP
jgi:ribosomal-protein-alanine N-acetyltransferase